ncbi:hypothetical protein FPQ18DRAFT_293396, partial [Pyronema domesticum]
MLIGIQASNRPLVLIGHSLGGLVLQQALVDAGKESDKKYTLLSSCIGILFFGVPHQGLNPISIQSLVKGERNTHFLQDLSPESEFLLSLRRDFRNCHRNFVKDCILISFYENKDTNSVKRTQDGEMKRFGDPIRMVSRDSAICVLSDDFNQISIQEDHSQMVKFRSRTDPHYQRVFAKIKETMENHEAKLSETSFTPMETTTPKSILYGAIPEERR